MVRHALDGLDGGAADLARRRREGHRDGAGSGGAGSRSGRAGCRGASGGGGSSCCWRHCAVGSGGSSAAAAAALPRHRREVERVRVGQHRRDVAAAEDDELVERRAVGLDGREERAVVEARRGRLAGERRREVLPAEAGRAGRADVQHPRLVEDLAAAAVAAEEEHAVAEARRGQVRTRARRRRVARVDARPRALAAVGGGVKDPRVVEARAAVDAAKDEQAAGVQLRGRRPQPAVVVRKKGVSRRQAGSQASRCKEGKGGRGRRAASSRREQQGEAREPPPFPLLGT